MSGWSRSAWPSKLPHTEGFRYLLVSNSPLSLPTSLTLISFSFPVCPHHTSLFLWLPSLIHFLIFFPLLIFLFSFRLSCSLPYLCFAWLISLFDTHTRTHTHLYIYSTWVCPLLPPLLLLVQPNLHLSLAPHSFLLLSQEPFSHSLAASFPLFLSLCLWAELYWERLAGIDRGEEGASECDEARGELEAIRGNKQGLV